MLNTAVGKKFLGFGKIQNCSNCNNEILLQIFADYHEMKVLGVSTGVDIGAFHAVCPTCEHSKKIKGSSLWAKDEIKQKLLTELDSGKEYTKAWFKKEHGIKNSKGDYFPYRKEYLKILNKCGAYSLVSFLSS
mgnify:CR=1 FL=1